jgi:hypothetical protein
LIFGYKQQGEEALKADNLFYYLCYEGAVDLSSISSYSERKSLEIQIQEFGQIPTQLFRTPHLPRVKSDLLTESRLLTSSGSHASDGDRKNRAKFFLANQFSSENENPDDIHEIDWNAKSKLYLYLVKYWYEYLKLRRDW